MPKPQGLMKRKGSSRWYYRQRRPTHLMRPGVRPHEIVSLGTSDYAVALTRLTDARGIIEARFREAAEQSCSPGIVSATLRRKRPDAPHLPLLTLDDTSHMARAYLQRELQHLDMAPLHRRSAGLLDPQRIEQELDDRITELSCVDDDEDAEHPAFSVEIGLLTESGKRSPYDSRASILLREYLRRAMLVIAKIERARFDGDFSIGVDDPLFKSASAPDRQVEAATSPIALDGPTVQKASERFLAELLQRHRAAKTQDRYRKEVEHIVSFLGPETVMADVRRQQCADLRDTFALLPPNSLAVLPMASNAFSRKSALIIAIVIASPPAMQLCRLLPPQRWKTAMVGRRVFQLSSLRAS